MEEACEGIRDGIKRLEIQLKDTEIEIQNGINQLKVEIQEAKGRMDNDIELLASQMRAEVAEMLKKLAESRGS